MGDYNGGNKVADYEYVKETAENFAECAYEALANVREVDTGDFAMLCEYALEDFSSYEWWDTGDIDLADGIIESTLRRMIAGAE